MSETKTGWGWGRMTQVSLATSLWILAGPLIAMAEEHEEGASAGTTSGLTVLGGGEVELTFPSSGSTQELSVHVEVEKKGFYVGAMGLLSNDAAADEIELTAGYRGETDKGFSYDLSYARLIHPNDGGDCCGEVTLSLGQSLGEAVDLSTDLIVNPELSETSISLGAEYHLSGKTAVSGNFGVFDADAAPTAREWDLGVTYALTEASAVDLRYYDGSDLKGYFGLSLTYDVTLLGG